MDQKIRVLWQQSNGAAIKSIYVFGERNSGTNYLEQLIARNCCTPQTLARLVDPENAGRLGWKHGFPAPQPACDDVLAIAIYRAPLAWLHSFHKSPWHAPDHLRSLSFSQFIRSEWYSIINDTCFGFGPDHPMWGHELLADRDPTTGARFGNPMQLRNAKNRGFAALTGCFANTLGVTYETVYAQPDAFLNALCHAYGLVRFVQFDPVIHHRGQASRGVFQAQPLPQISAADFDFLRRQLDLSFEAKLGYDLLRDCGYIAA